MKHVWALYKTIGNDEGKIFLGLYSSESKCIDELNNNYPKYNSYICNGERYYAISIDDQEIIRYVRVEVK